MTVQELAYWENDLYRKVSTLHKEPLTESNKIKLEEIYFDYKRIHSEYADLSQNDIEALKRGLFIQWYVMAEPSYLTGISNIEASSAIKILLELDKLIQKNTIETEL